MTVTLTAPAAGAAQDYGSEAGFLVAGTNTGNDGKRVKATVAMDPLTGLPVTTNASAAVALSSPAPTLTAGADTAFTFSSPVRHLFLENKSNTPAYYNLDTAASPGSYSLPAGAWRILDLPCTVLHLYATAALAVNGTVDLNIVVGGWR